MIGDRVPQLRNSGRRRIVRGAFLEPVDCGLDDRGWCIEIRFTDFQVNDASPLAFEIIGARQSFECRFTVNAMHPFGNLESTLCTHKCLLIKSSRPLPLLVERRRKASSYSDRLCREP